MLTESQGQPAQGVRVCLYLFLFQVSPGLVWRIQTFSIWKYIPGKKILAMDLQKTSKRRLKSYKSYLGLRKIHQENSLQQTQTYYIIMVTHHWFIMKVSHTRPGIVVRVYRLSGVAHTVVVFPRSTEDVTKIVKIAIRYRMPIIPYSGATSLEGQTFGVSRRNQFFIIPLEENWQYWTNSVQLEAYVLICQTWTRFWRFMVPSSSVSFNGSIWRRIQRRTPIWCASLAWGGLISTKPCKTKVCVPSRHILCHHVQLMSGIPLFFPVRTLIPSSLWANLTCSAIKYAWSLILRRRPQLVEC